MKASRKRRICQRVEIQQPSVLVIEQRRVKCHEQGADKDLAGAPDHVVPPFERDILVQHTEHKARDSEYSDTYAAEHQKMELPGMTTDPVKEFDEAERVVDEDENEEEQGHQDCILDLVPIAFRNAKRSVHITFNLIPKIEFISLI